MGRLATALVAGFGLALGSFIPAASAAPTGGAGGPLTDRLNVPFSANGLTSDYHIFAEGLDWDKEVGLLLYTDGSGGYGIDNPNSTYLLDADGNNGLVAVAKEHNLLLVTPEAPGPGCDGTDNCWYDSTAPAKSDWARALVDQIYSQYDIETDRVAIGGYSSGAQFTSRWFVPRHGAAVQTDGVFVPIAYGGAPAVSADFPQAYKDAVHGYWNTGTSDTAYSTSSWGARGGYNWYTANGFDTSADWPSGVGHGRSGEFDDIMDAQITEHVRPAQDVGTTPTPDPDPEPDPDPAPTAYATTVTPEESGVTLVIENVPANAPATYVRLTGPNRTTYLYTTEEPTADVTFTSLGTGGAEWSYEVYAGSSTSGTPLASGTFNTWTEPEPEPAPGDLTGDGVVNFADLQELSNQRPDDSELSEIVDNWDN